MTGKKDDSLDLTQETFIQAFESIEKFKGESNVYTWLYQIAKNKCLRYLQNQSRTSFENLEKLVYQVSSPIQEEISEEEKSGYIFQVKEGCLSGLLRCLSGQQRLAFILHVLLEMPTGHVAAIIDKSENATRILIHRARQNIKAFLCNNCSLFNTVNHCKCENLVNFSLKQKWIDTSYKTTLIEKEIKDIKNEVLIYKSLSEPEPSVEASAWLKRILAEKDWLIFENKKVK